MTRLREAQIRVFLISGNHDAASHVSRSLRLPENVHRFSTDAPESVVLDELRVAIHGQGFANARVDKDLTQAYPEAKPQHFNIGLLHTSLDGRPGHAAYAPCSLTGLLGKGYDYWALGHVHQREVVHENPWVVFPGNVQGRHIREIGPKSCTVVTVDASRVVHAEPVFIDVMRWIELPVDVSDCQQADDAIDEVMSALTQASGDDELGSRALAVRLRLIGTSAVHAEFMADPVRWSNEFRRCATDIGPGRAWIERVHFATRSPVDLNELATREDAVSELLREIETLTNNDEALGALAKAELEPMVSRVNRDLGTTQETQQYFQTDELRTLLHEARDLLITRLLSGERNT